MVKATKIIPKKKLRNFGNFEKINQFGYIKESIANKINKLTKI